jgi:hypothetical protein
MSTFRQCVEDGVRAGEITQAQADEYGNLFDELVEQYNQQLGPGPAQTKAGIDAAAAVRKKSIERKRQAMLQAITWKQISVDMASYRNIAGEQNMNKAALALFEQDINSKYASISQLEATIQRSATRKMDKFLATFRRDMIGRVRNKAQLNNMIKEVFNESTGDASARELALAWKEASEYLRKRFNAAGGAIPKRSDWGLPQQHSAVKVREVDFNEWRDFIIGRLDFEQMKDMETGLRFSKERLEFALKDVYDTISSDGASKIKPSGRPTGGKSLANRNADHRFLVFKNADAWMEYQQKFGNDNPFDVMMGHISNMSRDIAFMERLGPNPMATKNFIKQTLEKSASGDPKAIDAANSTNRKIDELYNILRGTHNTPVNRRWGTTFAGIRQLLQAAQLGAASISAITDVNFNRIARRMNGLPQTKTLMQYVKLLQPLGAEEMGKLAIRIGLTAEGWSTLAAAQMRYTGEISGPEVTRRVADFVMRASLLSPMTQAGRWAFGMEFLGTLADNVGKSFDELDPVFRKAMERYNINGDRWDIIRQTELYDYKGAKFLRAEDIEFRDDIDPRLARELATDIMRMVETETNFAVPSTSIRGRAALTGDAPPGTLGGEMVRSFAMYKNFGVTLMMTHIARGAATPGVKGKGRYYADLILSTTLMGALAIQLKEMSKGRDPRSVEDPEFWGAAFLQGGGLGIFGDFLFSDVNRYGGGLEQTIAGPVVGLVDDIRKLTIGNIYQAAQGEDTNVASEMIGLAQRYTPGTSLWYMRLGLERMVFDQAKLWADPDAGKKIRRNIRKYQREYGQDYWWTPGQMQPSRGPDFDNVFGN